MTGAREQILTYLDGPKREDRYHRTELDNLRLGDVSKDQLRHYLACRRQMENHLDEESVFDELCRLAMQSDEETCDWFDRITKREPTVEERIRLTAMAFRMWCDDEDAIAQDLAWKLVRQGYSTEEAQEVLGRVGIMWDPNRGSTDAG